MDLTTRPQYQQCTENFCGNGNSTTFEISSHGLEVYPSRPLRIKPEARADPDTDATNINDPQTKDTISDATKTMILLRLHFTPCHRPGPIMGKLSGRREWTIRTSKANINWLNPNQSA